MDNKNIICVVKKCVKCGKVWINNNLDTTSICEDCKQNKNIIDLAIMVKCNKCGHVWMPRSINNVNFCAKCKRTDWYK